MTGSTYNGAVNESHIQFLSSPEWAKLLETDLLPWVEAVGDLGDDVLEIGPGPGLTTDLLRARVEHLTALEIDPDLAEPLRDRLGGTNVHVICADARLSGLETDRFSTVTCFSMLHHVESATLQDEIFAEVARVLRPGGLFVGVDSLDLDIIRAGHTGDTYVPVDPATLPSRFEAAGISDTNIELTEYQFRFSARAPASRERESRSPVTEKM
jgi:SAM-dependent methyltransferase